jgi:hypothetical protein
MGQKSSNKFKENDDRGCNDFKCAHDTVPSSSASQVLKATADRLRRQPGANAKPRHWTPTSSPSHSTAGYATQTATAPDRAPQLCFPRRPDAPNPTAHDLIVPLSPPHQRPGLVNSIGVEFLISCDRMKGRRTMNLLV